MVVYCIPDANTFAGSLTDSRASTHLETVPGAHGPLLAHLATMEQAFME